MKLVHAVILIWAFLCLFIDLQLIDIWWSNEEGHLGKCHVLVCATIFTPCGTGTGAFTKTQGKILSPNNATNKCASVSQTLSSNGGITSPTGFDLSLCWILVTMRWAGRKNCLFEQILDIVSWKISETTGGQCPKQPNRWLWTMPLQVLD